MSKKINKKRLELLGKYASAAAILYGVLSVKEFVVVFNTYEDGPTTEDEVLAMLDEYAKDDDHWLFFAYGGGLIYNSFIFDEESIEDKEWIAPLRKEQQDKPRYLPDKEEFLNYCGDTDYLSPTEAYDDLKQFILTRLDTSEVKDFDIDEEILEIPYMIHHGQRPEAVIERFVKRGYKFKSATLKAIDDAATFRQKIFKAYANTRLYENNGFTIEEYVRDYGERN